MNIVEFLEARIAEDEAVARDASQGRWEVIPRGDQPEVQEVGTDAWLAITSSDPGRPKDANAKHIARHDPARVLAECKAKRVIIKIAVDQVRLGQAAGAWKNWEDMATQNLHTLAAVYADHSGYREEWALDAPR